MGMVRLLRPKVRIQRRVFRRWFKRVGIVFLFFCFFVSLFYFVFKSDFFIVKKVECGVKDKTSLADEKRWCDAVEREVLGQRIFFLREEQISGEIRERFLPVGEVAIERELPQKINIQITERRPISKICPPGGLELLVDKEGVIYAEAQPGSQGLKTVTLELGSDLAIGQKIDDGVVSLILLEEPQVSFVKYTGQGGMEIRADEKLIIFLSREKDLEGQIRALQTIVKKYKIEGKDLSRVDLRYDQPVIKY